MASGDFADLQLQLAYMSGRQAVSGLDAGDLALAKQCINEAYLDCYMNPGGTRPRWALQSLGIQFRAPISTTLGVTQGSTTVTGYSFPTDTVGSIVQIGSSYYTYAGLSGSTEKLVEPVLEATATYAVTIYHNCYPLSAAIIEVEGDPLVLGWGILTPMNSRGEQARWQQILYGDFTPHAGGGAYMTGGYWPGGLNYPTGTPLYYRVENGPLIGGNAIKCLFIIEPMPTAITTVQLQAWVVPTELSGDTDVPVLPAALSTRILLPLCRERWALIYKKYTGDNQQALVRKAGIAREILNRMSGGQRQRPVRTLLSNC